MRSSVGANARNDYVRVTEETFEEIHFRFDPDFPFPLRNYAKNITFGNQHNCTVNA